MEPDVRGPPNVRFHVDWWEGWGIWHHFRGHVVNEADIFQLKMKQILGDVVDQTVAKRIQVFP